MSNKCDNFNQADFSFVNSADIPSYDYINSLSLEAKNTLITTGDGRFNGMAVLSFLHERYSTNAQPNNEKSYMLPLYDLYKQQVVFPLNKDKPITITSATDAANKIVYFPFTDLYGNKVPYPLRDAKGNVVDKPASAHTVPSAATAYEELDVAYDNAKDSHAFLFNQQLINLKKNNKISFFDGSLPKDNNKLDFFTAAVYDSNANATDLTNIHSDKLKYIIRYYNDRKTYIHNRNKADSPLTTIDTSKSNSNDNLLSKIILDQNLAAANSIVSTNYWDPATPQSSYENNKIKTSAINASVIEQQKIIDSLTSRIEAIEASIP